MSSQYPILDDRPIDQWKVTELKEELKRRKLTTRGLKDDLIKRLNEAINVEREEAEKDEDNGLHCDPQDESDTKDAETVPVVSETAKEVVDIGVTKDEKLDDPTVQVDIDDSATAFSQGKVQKGESTGGIDSAGSEEKPVVLATNVETCIRITETAVSEIPPSGEYFQNTESQNDNGNSKAQLENEDSKSQREGEDPKSQLESEDLKSQLESGDSKAQLENKDSKSQLESEDPKSQLESEDPKSQLESVDSKSQLESEDSKSQLESGDSKAQLENEDLKAQLENEDLKAQLDNEDSKAQLENEDSKAQLANEDSKAQMANEDFKAQLSPQLENEDSKAQLENEDPSPPHEDAMLEPAAPNNQVSEVSPNLGFQVKSDSISTNSVSINEKIELKDNIIADNVKLELDVVKPEMVEPSSDEVVPVGGESHPMDVEEPHENKVSVEEKGDSNVTNADLNKKNGSADVGYSEKLNLDRSSGDDSMEEDVLETKQIDSKNNPDEVGDRSEKSEMNVVEEGTVDVGRESLGADKKDVHTENKSCLAVPAEKRKLHDQEAVVSNERLKRQRRWNSESLKIPEPQGSNITSTTTPKDTFQTTTLNCNFTRSDSTNSEDAPKERVVPPSPKPPTNSLRIDHFLRPFTLKAVQELLGKTGTVTSFWMDHIKTHCYVTYSSLEEATATRNAVYNLQWPPNGGRLLVAEFVDPREVKIQVETPKTLTTPVARVTTSPTVPAATPKLQPQPSPRQVPQQQLLPLPSLPPPPPLSSPPITREWLPPPPPLPEKVDPPIVTLDDLFRKTKTTPRIYYLPLSEEQVAAKLAVQARNTKQ